MTPMTSSAILHDPALDLLTFRREILAGLSRSPKTLPPKYFYDPEGSRLFEQITELPEYYLTRTELAIMEAHAPEMAARLGSRCYLIELGAGSSRKTRYLLDHLREPAAYVPVDISTEHLLDSAAALRRAYPSLPVLPVAADYHTSFTLPDPPRPPRHRAVYFPGSTIGNLDPPEQRALLGQIGELVGPGGGLLLGLDLKKEEPTLLAAYNDRAGVTAAFNKNILARINRELGATFDLDTFEHRATYDSSRGRIEMHLVSRGAQVVSVAGVPVHFEAGESIHTENSYKFDFHQIADLATQSGFRLEATWTDAECAFSVLSLVARPRRTSIHRVAWHAPRR